MQETREHGAAAARAGRWKKGGSRRGHAVIEVALLAPWIFFLFVGIFDWGFYSYGLVSVENAARSAALYTSAKNSQAADAAGACTYALYQLKGALGVGSGVSSCSSDPVTVTATAKTGADGGPASSVSVTYQSARLIPIPGLLRGRMRLTRTVEMRVRN